MGKVNVSAFSITLDGFSAGPDQSIDDPLGVNGVEMMEWIFPTKMFAEMQKKDGGETGIDNDFAAKSMTGNGAWILGRNMFGPIRGPWPDNEWKGWWGEEPPYHVPTFVLTHHSRETLEMEGGTTFQFVTDGIHAALERAREAAGEKDIRIGGGPSTIRQYLEAGLIDEMHVAVRPVLLGAGEPLFHGLDMRQLGYKVTAMTPGERAVHMIIKKVS